MDNVLFPGACLAGQCCHAFTRSDHICDNSTHREQFNGITAFIDGSNIYGSDVDASKQLRALHDGLMKVNGVHENLPTREQCGFHVQGSFEALDMVAGDVRAITQPALASIHTLFVHEHNRIARELKIRLTDSFLEASFTPTQIDEFIFQETRKIVGAELQNIVYKEYLPVVLGSAAMMANDLLFDDATLYDPLVDPSILNEFATVAYRFGHSTVRDIINGWPLAAHFLNSQDFFCDREQMDE